MEGQSSTGNQQYQYPSAQSAQWSRLLRRNIIADAVPNLLPSIAGPSQIPPQVEIVPTSILFQHQAQVDQYNRLIAAGRAQSSPLPPLLSVQHIQAVPGSRSGSSGGNTARNNKSSARGGHGNKEARKFSKGERALITEKEKEKAATMPPKKQFDLSGQLPTRPLPQHQNSNISHQSSSVPSTPHQHARKFSFESREPSPNATNSHSPRSAYSESNITLPSSRPLPPPRGGCRYETAMQHIKRRMPYSLGSEKLERLDDKDVKSKLSEDEERKLSTDMRELYDRLLPTAESETRRKKLVEKLEKLFNDEWPGHDIRVHVFGSSGNLLCTDQSDVDICITTDWKELEGVCMIADLLARSGMKEVICVSNAKVPIVKILDPELNLACDMNVNNTLALENTRMIKTYVEIDPRVRPLAMIIKHWTKRRIVNDAALGGTLSSYTWICMIINFLQSREPPVLPSLHQRPHNTLATKDGTQSSFADDLNVLRGFGSKNEETLGHLLFNFFRFYGHEFDYETLVISVRSGKQISKVDKKWHLANNNRLCVEEPFNVLRNLGNTADETSFRGLHIELRRAFDLVSSGKLEECCEQFEFPKEERQQRDRKATTPKPAIIRSASQSQPHRGGRGGGRGGRSSQQHRNGNNNRRASASGAYENHLGYPPMSAQETWMQQQAQAKLHNDLYTTYAALQHQENTLRNHLYIQSQQYMQAQAQNQNRNSAFGQSQSRSNGSGSGLPSSSDRNRTNSFDHPPLTAPLQNDRQYFFPLAPYNSAMPMYPTYQNPSTNPSSPSMSSAIPELRRSVHRSSVTNGSPGQPNSSMRSHSQPAARSVPSPLSLQGMGAGGHGLGIYPPFRQVNGVPIPNFIADENSDYGFETPSESLANTPPTESTEATPREYVGWYVQPGPVSNTIRRESTAPISSIPTFGEFPHDQGRRRMSSDQLPQSVLNHLKRPSRPSRSPSPSPLGHDRIHSSGAHSAPLTAVSSQQGVSSSNLRVLNNQIPPIVNGSNLPAPISIPHWQASVSEDSEDPSAETGTSRSYGAGRGLSSDKDFTGQLTQRDSKAEKRIEMPMVVNGTTLGNTEVFPAFTSPPVVNGASSHPLSTPNGIHVEQLNGTLRMSPGTRNRLTRQVQNGGMSPLDIGVGQNDAQREELPHLSPVYETRTPSPTANRKFEPGLDRKLSTATIRAKEIKPEELRTGSKLGPANGNQIKQAPSDLKPNGHTRGSKSEGNPTGGWQKIPKSKKKGATSENKTSGLGQGHSERFPNDDSERKGG